MTRFNLTALGLSIALVACGPRANPALCDLAQHRQTYAGRTVTVEGVLIVSAHGSVVTDPQCGAGIGIRWFRQDPSMRQLHSVAMQSLAKTMLVRVRLTGRIRLADRPSIINERAWELDLIKAHVLEARAISDRDNDRFETWLDGPSKGSFQPTS